MTTTGITADHLHVDDVKVLWPETFEVHDPLRLALSDSGSGRKRVHAPFDGEGLPNVLETFEWMLDYSLTAEDQETVDFLKSLRPLGGVHTICDWMERSYAYTARAGQSVFYLPRLDAFSKDYVGHTTNDFKARITVGVAAQTVVYKASVLSTDVVTAGEVWISKAGVKHPRAGYTVAMFKFGTTPAAGSKISVTFNPLFEVAVVDLPTKPFQTPHREDKTLYLAEIA